MSLFNVDSKHVKQTFFMSLITCYFVFISEGKGSLLYFLKAKGWASSLSAGVGSGGSERSSYAYIFEMSIHLTDSGLKNVCRLSNISHLTYILDGPSSFSFLRMLHVTFARLLCFHLFFTSYYPIIL